MLCVNKNEICTTLKNSEFYRNQINEDDVENGEYGENEKNEEIYVPLHFYKTNGLIKERLKTYHFWNVDKLPDDCIEYLLLKKKTTLYKEIQEMPFSTIEEKAQTLKELKYTGDYFFLGKNRNKTVIYSGNLEQLKTIPISEIDSYLIIFAKYGYLDCLKYAHENSCSWNKKICEIAAENGHLDCLKYAHSHGCKWDRETCSMASKNGHLECLKYAHENGCPWNKKNM